MANPTTYFGWVMPTATDLVTDLPADFNVFGQGVDTSMQDLLGGTTGQVLSKTTGTNMDFTWVTPTAPGGSTLISTTTLATITTTISSIPTTYKNLFLILKDVKPVAAGQELFMRVNADTGNNYTTVSTYGTVTAGATTGYVFGGTTSVALSNGAFSINNVDNQTFLIDLNDYTDTTSTRLFNTSAFYQNYSAAKVVQTQVAAYFTVGTAITSITIFMSGSTFSTGTAYLYGVN